MFDPLKPPPFPTRDNLQFESGAKFDIQLVTQAHAATALEIVGITREGPFRFKFTTNSTGVTETNNFNISDIPIFLSVHTLNETIDRGDIYATLYMRINSTIVMKYCSGYVSGQTGLAWPAVQSEPAISGGGKYRTVTGANPAAGAETYDSLEYGQHWILKAYKVTLVTDATAANRRVILYPEIHSGATGIAINSHYDQTASTTRTYYFAPYPSVANINVGTEVYVPIPPDLHIIGSSGIGTGTTNIQAGDNFGAPSICVEQYIEQL